MGKCPLRVGSTYYNYKDFHSIVLLAIVDGNYKFVAVVVGSYGREVDSGNFLKSVFGKIINSGNFNIPPSSALSETNISKYINIHTKPENCILGGCIA